jgi:predicted transcriptional regulator
MTALTLDLPDEKLRRLEVLAEARGTNIVQLFEEMSTAMLAEADAEARFCRRAQRGAGQEARGLELLDKAAGRGAAG